MFYEKFKCDVIGFYEMHMVVLLDQLYDTI